MSSERIIRCCVNEEIGITDIDRAEGIRLVLVDDNNIPIARYEFSCKKLNYIKKIIFRSNKQRIDFLNIAPTTTYEILAGKG